MFGAFTGEIRYDRGIRKRITSGGEVVTKITQKCQPGSRTKTRGNVTANSLANEFNYRDQKLPLASDPVFMFLQAMITRAPRFARSLAVSLPIPAKRTSRTVSTLRRARTCASAIFDLTTDRREPDFQPYKTLPELHPVTITTLPFMLVLPRYTPVVIQVYNLSAAKNTAATRAA